MRKWIRFQLGTPGAVFAVAIAFLITPGSATASSLLTLVNCGVSTTLDSIAVAFNCTDAAGLGLVGSMNQVGTSTSDTIMLNPLSVTNPTANLILDDTITIMNTYGFASPGPGSLAASYNV